jgi:hypothetical protein
MRRINKVAVSAGIAALMAVAAPAVATAATSHTGRSATEHTVREPAGFSLSSCTGPVFGNVQLRNKKSGNYLAESTVNDNLVLYSSSTQRWDGFRDAHGHLIIYRCGTNDVLTDNPTAHCHPAFLGCGYVETYNDGPGQWWNRAVDVGDEWVLQCVGHGAHDNVLIDPNGSKVSGTHVAMRQEFHNNPEEEFTESS